jgi:hypothetical protein
LGSQRNTKLDRAVLEHLGERLFSLDRCRELVRDVVEESGLLRRKTDEQCGELQRQIVDIDAGSQPGRKRSRPTLTQPTLFSPDCASFALSAPSSTRKSQR